MKRALSILAVTFLVLSAVGQNSTVTGYVKDGKAKQPIEFATATLYKAADSSLVTGTVTDVQGKYVLEKVPYGNYYLQLDFIGYESQFTSFAVNSKNTEVPLIDLALSAKNLEGFEVVEEKAIMEVKIDKKVFNASKTLTAQGGNGLDVLRETPLVSVDENDNIQLRGNTGVQVFINGRPSGMQASVLLKQIPASSIDRVEIITNPSAKYDPEGMLGIINVVLKKNTNTGLNANLFTSVGYGKFAKYNGNLGLNYRTSKLNLYGSFGWYYGKHWKSSDQDRRLTQDTVTDILKTDSEGWSLSNSMTGKLGLDYFVNDRNTLYASGSYNLNQAEGFSDLRYNNENSAEQLLSYSTRIGNMISPKTNTTYNAGWQHSLKKKGGTVDLDLTYNPSTQEWDEDLIERFYNTSGVENDTAASQRTLNRDTRDLTLAKLDVVYPIKDSLKIEFGSHFTGRANRSLFESQSRLGDAAFTPDTNISNDFKYDQQVYAAYATLAKQYKKIGVQAGLRAEQTYTQSDLITTNQLFTNDYFRLFPSLHLSYKTKKTGEFQLSYSRRINRPGMNQLNPFTNYSDPYSLRFGNPELQPEAIHVNELGYVKYGKKMTWVSTLYYRIIEDSHRRYVENNGLVSLVSYRNLGKSAMGGFELINTYTPKKGTSITATGTFWFSDITDDFITGGARVLTVGGSFKVNASTTLKNGWRFQMSGDYQPTMMVQQGDILPMYGMTLAASKSLFKRRGNLSIRYSDVFRTRWFKFRSYDLNGFSTDVAYYWESQQVNVSFSYMFGKMIRGKQKRKAVKKDASDSKKLPGM